MEWNQAQEDELRRYLLHDVPPEVEARIEEETLRDADLCELLQLIESELLTDYTYGRLSEREQQLFQAHFAPTPQRQQTVRLADAMDAYVAAVQTVPAPVASGMEPAAPHAADVLPENPEHAGPASGWPAVIWGDWFKGGWRWAAVAAVILLAAVGAWRWWPRPSSDVAQAESEMQQLYRAQWPLKTRVTGLDHAPRSTTSGRENDKDYLLRDGIASALRDAVRRRPDNLEARQALGRFYLGQQKFDEAQPLLEAVVQARPDNAQAHSDLGALLMEKSERSEDAAAARAALQRQALAQLSRALELDAGLNEARYNRALLYQMTGDRNAARADWEEYLARDPQSPWAERARRYLDELTRSAAQPLLHRLYAMTLAALLAPVRQAGQLDGAMALVDV